MEKLQPRYYQKKAVKVAINITEPEFVLELSQRSGKSLIMAEIAYKLNKKNEKCIIATETSILIEQIYKHIKMYSLEPHIIKAGMHQKGNCNIYLIMEQSFHKDRRKEFEHLRGATYLRDEYHIATSGKRFNEIIDFIQPNKIVGFSATPFTATGLFLKPNLIPYSIFPTTKAINAGYVAPLKWFIPRFVKDIEYDKVKDNGYDYSTSSLAEIQDTPEFYSGIKKLFSSIELDKNHTIVFCNNIEQAEKIYQIVKDIEPSTVLVHSKQNDKENQKNIEAFKNGFANTIISVMSLTIGFDAPIANQIVNLRRTKSFTLVRQALFRASNMTENKQYAKIYDIGGCLAEHGFIDKEDYVPQDNKKAVKEIIKNKKITALDEILEFKEDEDIVEFSKEKVKVYIQEMNDYKLEAMRGKNINQLLNAYNLAYNIEDILMLGSKIYDFIYETNTKLSTIDWIKNYWLEAIDKLPQKEIYFIKVLKTRCKNVIKQNKKFASLYYFKDFIFKSLKEQEPWLFTGSDLESDYSSDDEFVIPF